MRAARDAVRFYARMLGAERAGARFLARLGAEAADALDEFLDLALDYERRETPSLQGFVAWLRAARARSSATWIARDEVRVMTVHGAKGLEAPIVILADTTTPPRARAQPRLLTLPAAGGARYARSHRLGRDARTTTSRRSRAARARPARPRTNTAGCSMSR